MIWLALEAFKSMPRAKDRVDIRSVEISVNRMYILYINDSVLEGGWFIDP